jgi:hypothetical protein
MTKINDLNLRLLRNIMAGRTYCFSATATGLGFVVEGQTGYSPISPIIYENHNFSENLEYALELNATELKMEEQDAMLMIARSMKEVSHA